MLKVQVARWIDRIDVRRLWRHQSEWSEWFHFSKTYVYTKLEELRLAEECVNV